MTDPDLATQPTRAGRFESTAGSAVELWLATPDAARHFDPSRMSVADRYTWAAFTTSRRRRDWAASRALLAAVAPTDAAARSISHSHGHAALAVGPVGTQLGIDVEWLAARDYRSMAELAFSRDEADQLASLADPAAAARFHELWTLKEAFAKALGLPLADALRRCRWHFTANTTTAAIPTELPWRAIVFAPMPQLRIALAVVGAPLPSPSLRTMQWPPATEVNWPVVGRWSGAGRKPGAC